MGVEAAAALWPTNARAANIRQGGSATYARSSTAADRRCVLEFAPDEIVGVCGLPQRSEADAFAAGVLPFSLANLRMRSLHYLVPGDSGVL
eukprot:COSAG02_NODE_478_length_21511_cov_120.811087_21_plen_91_part_00